MKLSDTARIALFFAVSAVLLAAVFAAAGIAADSTPDVRDLARSVDCLLI